MSEPIFRQKSIERITSPDQMQDYIRVSNPQVWMILLAVVVLLIGVCVWGIFGTLDTMVETGGICTDGKLVCYLSEADHDRLQADAVIAANDEEYPVTVIQSRPVRLGESAAGADDYFLHLSGLAANDWVYEISAEAADLADGVYRVSVVVERMKPMDFVLN